MLLVLVGVVVVLLLPPAEEAADSAHRLALLPAIHAGRGDVEGALLFLCSIVAALAGHCCIPRRLDCHCLDCARG